jgi:hypothetical protein
MSLIRAFLPAAAPNPLIVAFDGDEYRDTMPLPHVLDSLLAAKRSGMMSRTPRSPEAITGHNGGDLDSLKASFV